MADPVFMGPLTQECGECGKQEAIVYCEDCMHALCYACTSQIHAFKSFNRHKLHPLHVHAGPLEASTQSPPLSNATVPNKASAEAIQSHSPSCLESGPCHPWKTAPEVEQAIRVIQHVATHPISESSSLASSVQHFNDDVMRSGMAEDERPPSVPTEKALPITLPPGPSTGPSRKMTKKSHITKEALEKQFHLPLAQAAKQFGVCVTFMKRICREQGILRWPYRKLRSLQQKLGDHVTESERDECLRAVYQAVQVDEERAPSPVCILGGRLAEDEGEGENTAFKQESIPFKEELLPIESCPPSSPSMTSASLEDVYKTANPRFGEDLPEHAQLLGDLCVFLDTEAGLTWLQSK